LHVVQRVISCYAIVTQVVFKRKWQNSLIYMHACWVTYVFLKTHWQPECIAYISSLRWPFSYLNRYIVLFQHRLLLIHYKIQPGRRHVNEQYRPDYRKSKLTSSYYMTNITSGEMEDCEWLRSTFSGPLSSRNDRRSIT
jgi:hypothetical protein